MLTTKQIDAFCQTHVESGASDSFVNGVALGADWANEKNAAEIAELRDVLRELMKAEYRLPAMYSSVIERAKELLEK